MTPKKSGSWCRSPEAVGVDADDVDAVEEASTANG
jgi:hypothetical protein